MKRPTLESALARKALPAPEPAPSPASKSAKVDDGKVTTSLRIRPDALSALKGLTVQRRCRVNDLILEAIDNNLALNGQRAAA